jgi:hypothetical protein
MWRSAPALQGAFCIFGRERRARLQVGQENHAPSRARRRGGEQPIGAGEGVVHSAPVLSLNRDMLELRRGAPR